MKKHILFLFSLVLMFKQMKKFIPAILFAGLIALGYSTKGQTNVYHPFPDSNAVWGMQGGCTDPNCADFSYAKYYYDGDTVIDGIYYKKIVTEVLPLTNGSCCYVPTGLGVGFLRQDIAEKKVYWRNQWTNGDTLLYDFTLNVGDTLNSFLNYPDPWTEPKTVLSIDSVLVGTSYHKRFNIDTSDFRNEYTYSIIEGVGSTDGFSGVHENNAWQFGIGLTCFSENGDVVYTPQHNPDTIPCGDLPVGINDLNQKSAKIVSVFPNPSSGRITLTCQESSLPLKIIIYDMFGRKHLEVGSDKEFTGIDISELSPGIYYLRAETNKTLVTLKKIIKL
jgi:hypothetical protein